LPRHSIINSSSGREADVNANYATVALDSAWQRLVSQAEAPNSLPDEWNDPMVVQATAGTTGLPKFTVATHLQFCFRLANYYCEVMRAIGPHRYLTCLPLFFSYGRNLCLMNLLHRATLIFHPSVFNAAEFVETAARHQITMAAIVPSSLRQLLAAADSDEPLLPGLQILLSAGAPLFVDEKRKTLRKLMPYFCEVYAASAFGPISVLRPKDVLKSADSVGRPVALAYVEIVDDEDRPVVIGEAGRLRCRGPSLASPIPGQNNDDFRHGWHYPGELAAFDEYGYLRLRGRTSEVVFRGGAKIFPTEVEAVLQEHEKAADAAVVGRGSSDNEHELAAYVIAKGEVTAGQLLLIAGRGLPPIRYPGRSTLS
jgi:fatty-acyl-CoA synthase